MTTIDKIVYRKRNGQDCTDDESAMILRYFDGHHPYNNPAGREIAALFPLEVDQWVMEMIAGDRPLPFS